MYVCIGPNLSITVARVVSMLELTSQILLSTCSLCPTQLVSMQLIGCYATLSWKSTSTRTHTSSKIVQVIKSFLTLATNQNRPLTNWMLSFSFIELQNLKFNDNYFSWFLKRMEMFFNYEYVFDDKKVRHLEW